VGGIGSECGRDRLGEWEGSARRVGGIGSETLLRDMMDLDCWIVSTGAGQATGLPDSRDAFWRVIREEGMGGRRVYTSSAPLSLPSGIKNPRIRPFMSGAYAGTIPAEILPLEPEAERALVGTLLQELNEKFCVNVDLYPSLDHSIPAPPIPCITQDGRYSLGDLT
jgi:hypothetical protein